MSNINYLDNAATSFPKPDIVHDSVRAFYSKSGINPGRTGCDMALSAEQMVSGTRQKLSDLFERQLEGHSPRIIRSEVISAEYDNWATNLRRNT